MKLNKTPKLYRIYVMDCANFPLSYDTWSYIQKNQPKSGYSNTSSWSNAVKLVIVTDSATSTGTSSSYTTWEW